MVSSMIRSISRILLLLSYHHVFVQGSPVNTTLYSTHPQVTYAPESCCMRNVFQRCVKRYDPFTMSSYIDPPSGLKRTFFQTSSWGNEPYNSNMKRRVEVSFHGHAVYVYGPPREHLDNRPGHIEIWVDKKHMETIDLDAKYRDAADLPWNPLLMYHWEGVFDKSHTLEINLLDGGSHPIHGFGFDSIVFTADDAGLPRKYELLDSEKLENITIHDTNFVSSFSPSYAWDKQVSPIASADGTRTFHATSNELTYDTRRDGGAPVVEFTAKCAALAVYGASPAQLDATFRDGFRHGHVQICHGGRCDYIDADRAYNTVPNHLRSEPVLLYATDRMSPKSAEMVTMSMLDPPSPVGHLWTMTFSHAVCSQVAPKWSGTHPVPNGRYSKHTIEYTQLHYGPSYFFGSIFPWSWLNGYSSAPAKAFFWFIGLFGGEMPSWSTIVLGHDIKIFLPSPGSLGFRHANVLFCIDGRCHYPDVEQWFLKARDSPTPVPFVHYQDLHPFKPHQISVTAVRGPNEGGEKEIAVSHLEVQRVVMPPPPPPPRPSPSPTSTSTSPRQTEHLPSPEVPRGPSDNTVRIVAIVSLAVVMVALVLSGCSCILILFRECFGCICGISVGRDSREREPLVPGGRARRQDQWQRIRQPPTPPKPTSNPRMEPPSTSREVPYDGASDTLSPQMGRGEASVLNSPRWGTTTSPNAMGLDLSPPPYTENRPPSYMACAYNNTVTTPPQRHPSMTTAAPPPRRPFSALQQIESEASGPYLQVPQESIRGGRRHRDRRSLDRR